ncbi:MAG: translesion DNA synthesis-associated protein ImuA [Gammaproteobacteria bacterium]|nr:translesion DNA synthesis-associated protein ImuA [Gammaproteobacteria bacterium]
MSNVHSAATLPEFPGIWRGGETPAAVTLASGFAELDAVLPGGGWPVGALTEILSEHPGTGELSLPLPALGRLSRAGRWLIWVAPPCIPYAPTLRAAGLDLARLLIVRRPEAAAQASAPKEALWALEQALRFPGCGAALGWLERASMRVLRRLQLAAEAGGSWALLYRPAHAAEQPSPAALRLLLRAGEHGWRIEILKCRGGRHGAVLELPRLAHSCGDRTERLSTASVAVGAQRRCAPATPTGRLDVVSATPSPSFGPHGPAVPRRLRDERW